MIPVALYYQREWRKCPLSPWVHENAVQLWEKTEIGYSDWGRLQYDPPKDVKIFLPSSTAVDFPFSIVPEHIVSCGPIVRPAATVEEADPKLAAWLHRRPTVYINLGTHVLYDNDNKRSLAGAIKLLLEAAAEQKQDIQVLWKVNRDKAETELGHATLYKEVGSAAEDERLLIVDWLVAEPISVLNSGAIVCSVNHGGANTYFEAVRYDPIVNFEALFTNFTDGLTITQHRCSTSCPSRVVRHVRFRSARRVFWRGQDWKLSPRAAV